MSYNIMIMGASYGSLLGAKLLLAGHNVTLMCMPHEAELINSDGIRVRMPVRGREGLVELDSRKLPGKLTGIVPADVNPSDYDLIGLAMQEPQFGSPGAREVLDAVGKSNVPCMSIMNMPPLPYMARIPGVDASTLTHCYTDASVWDSFTPANLTLCSPDPQAFRPPEEECNILQVALPTNFKVARFDSEDATNMLRQLQADIEAARYEVDGEAIELPVKLKVHDSIFVPLAKWSMLMTGNYRCVQADAMRPIKEAVHSDIDVSRAAYKWVSDLCVSLGADASDMVPFEKYANAANGLAKPSSAARALDAGAKNIERVDCLVRTIAAQKGLQSDSVDSIVELVDGWLAKNRSAG